MACESKIRQGQTAADREREIQETIAKLEQALQGGTVTIRIDANGGIVFENWQEAERNGVNDACAFRLLTVAGSFALQQALATAEAMSGMKANQNAVMGGLHSHDGGKTWGYH